MRAQAGDRSKTQANHGRYIDAAKGLRLIIQKLQETFKCNVLSMDIGSKRLNKVEHHEKLELPRKL